MACYALPDRPAPCPSPTRAEGTQEPRRFASGERGIDDRTLRRHRRCDAHVQGCVRRRAGPAGHDAQCPSGRVRRRRRPVGLWQVVIDEARDRSRPARFRRHRHLRRQGARPGEDRRHGIPKPQPAAVAQGDRQRAAAAGDRAAASPAISKAQGGVSRKGQRTAQDRRARWLRRALSVGTLRRHAAARVALPRTDPRAGVS